MSKFRKRNKILLSLVYLYVLHKTLIRHFHAVVEQKRAKLLFCLLHLLFFYALAAVALSDIKSLITLS